MAQVKCSECGFLALLGYEEDTINHANRQFRETGKPTRPRDRLIYQDAPICFASAIDIHHELNGKSYGEIGLPLNARANAAAL